MGSIFRAIMATSALTSPGGGGGTGGSSDIPAPEIALPASTVGGPTTSFNTGNFTQGAFQTALSSGGTIQFAAGTYDLSGWSCVHTTSSVRIVGAGKGSTVFTGDTSKTYGTKNNVGGNNWFNAGEVDLFMVPRARVEIQGVTFDHWKMVFPIANGGSGTLGDLGNILSNLAADGATPATFSAGVILDDVGFTNVGYVMAANQGSSVYNVYAYGCDFINCNACLMLQTDPIGNIYVYDCLFQNINCPEQNRANGKPQNSTGIAIRLGENVQASTPYTGCVIQNCTVDEMVLWADYDAKISCPESGLVNARGWDGLKVANCILRLVGRDASGNSGDANDNMQAIYLKGSNAVFDNIEFDRCVGEDGIITIKGTVSANHTLRNLWFHDNWPTIRIDGANSAPIVGLLGGNCVLGPTTIENVLIEDCSANAQFGPVYGTTGPNGTGIDGDLTISQVSVLNSDVDSGLFFVRNGYEDVNVSDIYFENVGGTVLNRNGGSPTITYSAVEIEGGDNISTGTAGTISGSTGTATRADLSTTVEGGTLPVRGCATRA